MHNEVLPPATPVELPSGQPGLKSRGWRQIGRLSLELRQQASPALQALVLGGAVLLGIGLSSVLLVIAGVQPRALFDEVVVDTLLDPDSFRSVLFQAAPLIFVGLGAAVAFRVRF